MFSHYRFFYVSTNNPNPALYSSRLWRDFYGTRLRKTTETPCQPPLRPQALQLAGTGGLMTRPASGAPSVG